MGVKFGVTLFRVESTHNTDMEEDQIWSLYCGYSTKKIVQLLCHHQTGVIEEKLNYFLKCYRKLLATLEED